MPHSPLFQSLLLPNGKSIPNRIAKAAMDSNLADEEHAPGTRMFKLYQRWADGGAGLIITGNVMVDRYAMTGPGSVVLESAANLAQFKKWAAVCSSGGAQAWMQLNHPGRQVLSALGQQAWAPSSIGVDPGDSLLEYALPEAMSEAQILDVIQRFASSAQLAEAAGFSGVQINAAQGFLISQFLSPRSNQRDDAWGGSLAKRARLLLEIVKRVRQLVSPEFCVAVSLNASDFSPGGFDLADACWVVQQLGTLAVDLLEISGGCYESPAMFGQGRNGQPLAQEIYFLELARQLQPVANMPLMLTGGIRRRAAAEQVLQSGIAMVGIATALVLVPDLLQRWREGDESAVENPPVVWPDSRLSTVAVLMALLERLREIGSGKAPSMTVSPKLGLLHGQLRLKQLSHRYRRWLVRQVTPAESDVTRH